MLFSQTGYFRSFVSFYEGATCAMLELTYCKYTEYFAWKFESKYPVCRSFAIYPRVWEMHLPLGGSGGISVLWVTPHKLQGVDSVNKKTPPDLPRVLFLKRTHVWTAMFVNLLILFLHEKFGGKLGSKLGGKSGSVFLLTESTPCWSRLPTYLWRKVCPAAGKRRKYHERVCAVHRRGIQSRLRSEPSYYILRGEITLNKGHPLSQRVRFSFEYLASPCYNADSQPASQACPAFQLQKVDASRAAEGSRRRVSISASLHVALSPCNYWLSD